MAPVEFIDLTGNLHEDSRGFVFFPCRDQARRLQDLQRTFHLVSIEPGQARGHHLHPGYEEWLYPFHGRVVFLWEEPPGQVRERVLGGRRTLVRIPPGVGHAVRNPGSDIVYLLAWREPVEGGEATPETVPWSMSPTD